MENMLPIIGGFYTVASLIALTGGAVTMISLRRASAAEREAARRHAPKDYLMFAAWLGGFVGGVGILLQRQWGLYVLELFCYALVIMTCMSMYNRYLDVKRRAADEHVNWLAVLGGLVLVGIPVMVIAYLTIAALRSDSVRAAFLP